MILTGKYGLKIKNYQAAAVYEYANGYRKVLDGTDAMLVNSLFLDYLYTLSDFDVYKDKATRDIICLEFGYKTKGYAETIERFPHLLDKVNPETCVEISRSDLRIRAYTQGVTIRYHDGSEIEYKMLYRTPGKAKKGTCMFINAKLYDRAHDFLYMGITLPEKNSPIVEVGAYASLITSSIVGKVQILPHQILIVDDLPTCIRKPTVNVVTDENKQCVLRHEDEYDITGEAFDGQALIDFSIFPEWGNGYILLRHHFTKCAAFKTDIQLFMRDYFGEAYETATVKDMWGVDRYAKDIRLITTKNAIKWLKFPGVTFDYWCERMAQNDYQFGIVKTAHESKLGKVQRMSYQMVNSLDMDTMQEVASVTVDYITRLKQDNDFFLDYLRDNSNFSNDYEVLVALAEHNPEFVYSQYFRERKKIIISAYVTNAKSGKILQNADNLTIVGSPYGMLLHSVGDDARLDPTFRVHADYIECATRRFMVGEFLAEFRSPFNSRNNLGYMRNCTHPYLERYFDFGTACIAVNTIDTDWQSRNNGLNDGSVREKSLA